MGLWGDKFGEKKVIIRIVFWWSLFTALTGLVTGFASLFVVRFLFGAGEAGAYPNSAISIRKWFPTAERGRAQSFIWMASRIGGAIANSVWLARYFLFFGRAWLGVGSRLVAFLSK